MKCRHCGTSSNLVWDSYCDEDGFVCEAPIDLCEHCEDVLVERSRQRDEWDSCHYEPCPECELTPMPVDGR